VEAEVEAADGPAVPELDDPALLEILRVPIRRSPTEQGAIAHGLRGGGATVRPPHFRMNASDGPTPPSLENYERTGGYSKTVIPRVSLRPRGGCCNLWPTRRVQGGRGDKTRETKFHVNEIQPSPPSLTGPTANPLASMCNPNGKPRSGWNNDESAVICFSHPSKAVRLISSGSTIFGSVFAHKEMKIDHPVCMVILGKPDIPRLWQKLCSACLSPD